MRSLPARVRTAFGQALELLPWLTIAVLLHVAVLEAAYLLTRRKQHPERILRIEVVTEANPYLTSFSGHAPSPRPRRPSKRTPDQPVVPERPAAPAEPLERPESTAPLPAAGVDSRPPAPGAGRLGKAGPGADNGEGGGGPFDQRRGPGKTAALRSYGGTQASESAVQAGLRWLAAHQRPDGIWSRCHFTRMCPSGDLCPGEALKHTDQEGDLGVTGLATLAFLAAGNTHQAGPYRDNVTRALNYMLHQQYRRGSFGPVNVFQMYAQAIATMAVAEDYAVTADPRLRRPLQRAVRFLLEHQQAGGGWDYTEAHTGRNDVSVTGWAVMALNSAAAAGIDVPAEPVLRVLRLFHRATGPDGRVWYTDRRTEGGVSLQPQERKYGPAMVGVGMLCLQLLGFRPDSQVIATQRDLLLGEPPDRKLMTAPDPEGLHTYYYWYHATLALFHLGGPAWGQWNRLMQPVVVAMQNRSRWPDGKPKHRYGMWPPYGYRWGRWGRYGGAVYSTALNTLTLAVYYRYLPMWRRPRPLSAQPAVLEVLADGAVEDRTEVIEIVRQLRDELAEPLLVRALADPVGHLRLRAALRLAEIGNPLAAEVLSRQLDVVAPDEKPAVEQALERVRAVRVPDQYGGVRRYDPDLEMLLFATAGQPVYVGQRLGLWSHGTCFAELRVDAHYRRRRLAAATVSRWLKDRPGKLGPDFVVAGPPSDSGSH